MRRPALAIVFALGACSFGSENVASSGTMSLGASTSGDAAVVTGTEDGEDDGEGATSGNGEGGQTSSVPTPQGDDTMAADAGGTFGSGDDAPGEDAGEDDGSMTDAGEAGEESGDPPPVDPYGPCDEPNECSQGSECYAGGCAAPCQNSGDCPAPIGGTSAPFCPSKFFRYCVLPCQGAPECPPGMTCYQYEGYANCGW